MCVLVVDLVVDEGLRTLSRQQRVNLHYITIHTQFGQFVFYFIMNQENES
jgi:hypothetical protein